MKILGCIRPQKTVKSYEEISPTDVKTKGQSYKIAYSNEPGFFKRFFTRNNKTDETTRLT